MLKRFFVSLLMAFTLAACATDQYGQKQTAGTLVGAGLGALAGSQVGQGKGQLAAVAIGTLLGALAGNEVGKSLDKADQLALSRAGEVARTAPIGKKIAWSNPDSGNFGSVTPVREGRNTTNGNYCREFQQTITIGGRTEDAHGVACRQPDGSWRITN